jgi:hypothetical protein
MHHMLATAPGPPLIAVTQTRPIRGSLIYGRQLARTIHFCEVRRRQAFGSTDRRLAPPTTFSLVNFAEFGTFFRRQRQGVSSPKNKLLLGTFLRQVN